MIAPGNHGIFDSLRGAPSRRAGWMIAAVKQKEPLKNTAVIARPPGRGNLLVPCTSMNAVPGDRRVASLLAMTSGAGPAYLVPKSLSLRAPECCV